MAEAQRLYEATPQTNRRQTHAAVQEKINTLLSDIRLYEKGLKVYIMYVHILAHNFNKISFS